MDRRDNERGVALILVLVVLPLVAILMTQLNFETTIGAKLANNALTNQQFKGAIRARLEQMKARLRRDLIHDEEEAQQGGAFDHYSDDWGSKLEGGGTAARVSKGDEERGDMVSLYTEVYDEQGKFNLNLILHRDLERSRRAQEVLRNLLDFFRDPRFGDIETPDWDLSEAEARELTTAILKFLQGEGRDERVRKADLPDPTPEMRQGVFSVRDLIFCHRLMGEKRLLESFTDMSTGERMPGLVEFLTVFGDGRINANTAPLALLRAIFKESEAQQFVAENLYKGRGGFLNTDEDREARDHLLEDRREAEVEGEEEAEITEIYRSLDEVSRVEGMGDSAMLRRNEIDVARDFTVRSNFFTVVVTARRDDFLRQQRVVYERHSNGCLTWSSEVVHAEIRALPESLLEPEGAEAEQ